MTPRVILAEIQMVGKRKIALAGFLSRRSSRLKNRHPRQAEARHAHVGLARLDLHRRRLLAGALPLLLDLGALRLVVAAQPPLLLLLPRRRRLLRLEHPAQ